MIFIKFNELQYSQNIGCHRDKKYLQNSVRRIKAREQATMSDPIKLY